MIDHDVETDGFQWYAGHRPFLHQFMEDDGTVHLLDPHTQGEQIQALLNRATDEGYRAWNSKFDLHHAKAQGFELPDEASWHDGMLEAHAIDERRSIALQNVAAQLLGDDAKTDQKKVHAWLKDERARRKKAAKEAGEELIEPNFGDVPDEIMHPYAAEDVVQTRKVSDIYSPVLDSSGLREIVDFERGVMGALFHVEERGMPVDEEGYRKLEIELIENLERLEDRCQSLARPVNDELNLNSSPQLYQALEALDANLAFVTNQSMDRENLETVDHPLAAAILAFRSEYKALSTYVHPMIDRHYETRMRAWKEQFIQAGKIHTNYRQVGARTGRMSSADPNMQNQPRDDLRLRYNIRAEPGKKLVVADLSGVEFRIFAAYAGDGPMLQAIRDGRDVHELAAKMIGIRDRKRQTGTESARQRGKVFNFSQLYGGGLRTIRKQLGCSMDQARLYRNRYRDAFPEIVRLQNRIEWRLQDQGYIKSAWGRHFRGQPRDAYKYTNYLVQGTAADLLKESLVRLHAEGIPVVGLVHDEIIAHCDEGDAAEVQHAIERALIEHPRITEKVPLEADGAIVDRWSQAKKLDFVPRFAGGEG